MTDAVRADVISNHGRNHYGYELKRSKYQVKSTVHHERTDQNQDRDDKERDLQSGTHADFQGQSHMVFSGKSHGAGDFRDIGQDGDEHQTDESIRKTGFADQGFDGIDEKFRLKTSH